jgi:CheY-like chemotaxis protein
MSNILIIDDNHAASAFLKLSLQGRRHRVNRSVNFWDAIDPAGIAADLVLINRAFKNNTGWQAFNFLKQAAPHLPAMVYVLEHRTAANAGWIIRAVETVIPEFMREAAPLPHFTDTGTPRRTAVCCPIARIAQFRQVLPDNHGIGACLKTPTKPRQRC